ncbi:MAG: beta-carotene 15,15'-dioxygenase, Brp/Blh family, partial [Chthoniobacterales bacterium]
MSDWLPSFQRRHTLAVVVLLASALATSTFLPSIPLAARLTLLAAGVGIFGLPHGALDLNLIRGAKQGSRAALAAAIVLYLAAAATVLAVWLTAPVFALVTFLAIAVIHFGLGDTEDLQGPQRALEVVARGGFVGIAPMVFYPATTRELFAMLVGPESIPALDSVLGSAVIPAAWLWAICFTAALLWRLLV